jgi:hypothetical protein
MRLFVAAFAAGIWLLQQQAACLPSLAALPVLGCGRVLRRHLLKVETADAKVGAGDTAICGAGAADRCRRRVPRLRLGGEFLRSCAWPTNCLARWKAATSN